MKISFLLWAVVALVLQSGITLAAQLVTNGSFENPVQQEGVYTTLDCPVGSDFYGWTVISGRLWGGVQNWEYADPAGSQHMWAGQNANGAYKSFKISQNIGSAKEGSVYVLSVYAWEWMGTGTALTYRLKVGGIAVCTLSNNNPSTIGWEKTVLPSYIATSGDAGKTISVEISVVNNGTSDTRVLFDNISVEAYWCADINRDGEVDLLDMSVIASNWLAHGKEGDIDNNGILNFLDFAFFAGKWLDESFSPPTQYILIDGSIEGRVFDGIGALSAGASSRLLFDYPEPQRSQILDLLFKPNFGASLQHLKVEVGGGINSTCGTEPSHARTRDELNNPRQEYYQRGHEWWLMEEAKKRNPDIILDILPWGAPGWIGNGNFYSQDMADYMVAFIKGAKQYYNLDIDYTGIWNEMSYDINYIKLLRQRLDANGLGNVKIIAADVWGWSFVEDLIKDVGLQNAVYAVGNHYSLTESTEVAKQCSKPLWASEDGPWSGEWGATTGLSPTMQKLYNCNYINGKITKTVIWALISSYYTNLPFGGGAGLMRANTPWSGAFEVQPAIWITAHTTQFAKPGWKYLEGGSCGFLSSGGSFVTLKAPNGQDYSIIIETEDASKPQKLRFKINGGLAALPLHVWRSNSSEQFIAMPDIQPVDGQFTLNVNAKNVYSLTTTSGQNKGFYQSSPQASFPAPYANNFEQYAAGSTPRYFSDQGGTFEVANRSDGNGMALRQVVTQKGIEWNGHKDPYPETFLSDTNWINYEVSVDAMIEQNGFVSLYGRVGGVQQSPDQPNAYCLRVYDSGWELRTGTSIIASGFVAYPVNTWHRLKLRLDYENIKAFINESKVADVNDYSYMIGSIGLGSGWNAAQFDNVSVTVTPMPVNLALSGVATSSSQWSPEYSAEKANDGLNSTRWNSENGKTAGEWLEIDFASPITFNQTIIQQWDTRISSYKIQYWNGSQWIDCCTGGPMGISQRNIFSLATASRVRLYVVQTNGATPTICEFGIYNVNN